VKSIGSTIFGPIAGGILWGILGVSFDACDSAAKSDNSKRQ